MSRILPRFSIVLLVMLGVEAALFAAYHRDLLFLRSVTPESGHSAAEFHRHARMALQRKRLTRDHLETLATLGERHETHDVEVAALERMYAATPSDALVALRLADAYRRARRFAEAEALYNRVLDMAARGSV